ncbi:MAG: hypothetical protein WBA28_02345 [Microbacteriaceae bacterium]
MPSKTHVAIRPARIPMTEQGKRLSAGGNLLFFGGATLLISIISYLSLVRFDGVIGFFAMLANVLLFISILAMRFHGVVSHRRAMVMVSVLVAMWLVIIAMYIVALIL